MIKHIKNIAFSSCHALSYFQTFYQNIKTKDEPKNEVKMVFILIKILLKNIILIFSIFIN